MNRLITVLATVAALAGSALPAAAAAAGPPAPGHGGPAVAGWGSNLRGQLGTGHTGDDVLRPVLARLPHGTRITQVSSGCEFSLALTTSGRVLSWGENDFGQLGNGTIRNSATPAPVKLPAGVRITAISAGCEFGLALTAGGQLMAWGNNEAGQLGNGEIGDPDTSDGQIGALDQFEKLPVLVHLPAGVRVRAAAASFDYTLAVSTTGQVYAWGENSRGELGNGKSGPPNPVPGLVHLPAGTRVTAVTAGDGDSLAVTARGGVLGWGLQGSGDLGNGKHSGFVTTPVSAHLPAGVRVRRVFAGCSHTLALTASGSVLGWGDNRIGQVGTARKNGTLIPVRVPLPRGSRVVAIGGGCRHSLALTSRGQVLAWGDRTNLGTGATRNSAVPVQVQLPARTSAIAISSGEAAGSSLAVLAG